MILNQLKVYGNGRPPDPPRDLQAQPGSRGALLTWSPPASGMAWIRGWRVYKESEFSLLQEIHDPNQQQLYVPLSSGSVPPPTNFFISSVTAAGVESVKVLIQAVALAEVGAPIIPTPPPGHFQSWNP